MRIFICGLTGTGKSTVAKAVAEALGYEYMSSSAMLREFAGVGGEDHTWWSLKGGKEFMGERLKSDLDEKFDKYLLDVVDEKDNFVMDSWTMPWLYKDQALRIYLKCPFSVRASRVMFRDKLSEEDAKQAVKQKDTDTRKIYMQNYCYDVAKDTEDFDLIVNTQYFDIKGVILFVLNYVKTVEKYYE